jgi:hypothetical protein
VNGHVHQVLIVFQEGNILVLLVDMVLERGPLMLNVMVFVTLVITVQRVASPPMRKSAVQKEILQSIVLLGQLSH